MSTPEKVSITKKTSVSLGLIFTIAGILITGFGICYSTTITPLTDRVTKLEDFSVNVYGDVRQMKGQIDYLYRRQKEKDEREGK